MAAFICSCQNLKPDENYKVRFPEINNLIKSNLEFSGASINKVVSLDGIKEEIKITPDSTQWNDELDFLNAINPNKPEFKGSFDVVEKEGGILVTLKTGEKHSLQQLSYSKEGENETLKALIQEDKQIFSLEKRVKINFAGGLISNYKIEGFQKILLKDTTKFMIKVEIN